MLTKLAERNGHLLLGTDDGFMLHVVQVLHSIPESGVAQVYKDPVPQKRIGAPLYKFVDVAFGDVAAGHAVIHVAFDAQRQLWFKYDRSTSAVEKDPT